MKIKNSLIAAIFFAILISSQVLAVQIQVTELFNCGGCCIEGKEITTRFAVKNTGSNPITIQKVLYATTYDQTFVSEYVSFYLESGQSTAQTFSGQLPAPTSGNSLSYKVCLYLKEKDTLQTTYYSWDCSTTGSIQVTPAADFTCYTDANCPSEKFCSISESGCTSSCRPVKESGTCGYVSNHKWVNYQCCADSDCTGNQKCVNHYCANVPCECGYMSGHECIRYECCSNTECRTDQQCVDHTCKTPDCGYCSYVSGNQCVKYECCSSSECKSDEQCLAHSCAKLSCGYGEYMSNHQCTKYQCMSNNDCRDYEACRNNKCVGLGCASNEIAKYHQCEKKSVLNPENAPIIIIIVVVAIVSIILIYFLYPYITGAANKTTTKAHENVCHKCKKKVSVHDEFCINCGAKVHHIKEEHKRKKGK